MAATGHDGAFLVAEPATCTEDGYENYYCETCGEAYTVVLPATGHTWTEGGLVPYCTVCNYGRTGDPAFWSLRNTDLVSSVEETYSYVYNGSLLTQMTKDGTSLLFVYDASGRPSELRYNGYYYHYVTNIQGDVIAILDEYGVVVAEYSYDAWGNILTVTGSMASTLGRLNPLTYRGYVYDWETGLYYLQSRYYNPERGRFINADSYVSTGQGFIGNNMFAYCLNNPIICKDLFGESAGLAAITAYLTGATTAGTANLWNPAGWAILGTVAVGCIAVAISSTASRKTWTRKKTLADVKVKKQSDKKKLYQMAFVSYFGSLIRFGPKMTFAEALAALGVTGAANSVSKRYKYDTGRSSNVQRTLEHLGTGDWGIYASTQSAAKALAYVFGATEAPEVHGSGKYGHYHDGTHTFHIWFGGVINY